MGSDIAMCESCGNAFNISYLVVIKGRGDREAVLCRKCKRLVYPDREGGDYT